MLRVRKHKSDKVILFLTLTLMIIGLIIIYVIGPMRANVVNGAYGKDVDSNYYFTHHLLSVIIALACLIFAFKFPYEKISNMAKWILILALGAQIVLWFGSLAGSSIAICENGACRWISVFGLISFQPAEFLKLALVIYLADFIGRKKKEGKIGTKDFWIPIAVISIVALALVVVAQSDLGTGLAIIAIILGMLLVSEIPLRQFVIVLGILMAGGVVVIVASPYRMERVMTFVGGGDDTTNYHVENAMIAIGTGGLTGVGIGNSVQATGYLPESINDSVFAILGETFGFVGLALIVGVFATMLFRMIKVAEKTDDMERRLVTIGVFSWIATHVVANMMAMLGMIPLTGVTLPFLSYGGTSMLFVAMAMGFVLQLSCYTGREVKNESIDSGRGLRWARDSGRRSRS